MLRRLYFLFPDEDHAQRAVEELIDHGIPMKRMHSIASSDKFNSLPKASERQKNDTAFHIEQFIWKANLLVFAVALIALIVSLLSGAWFWSGIAIAIMLATFFAGKFFVEHVPNDHLTEFTDALARGEILLMVDIPIYRVTEITKFVKQHHPETALDGLSWTIDAFEI